MAITFTPSFFSLTLGYLRFAVKGKIPLVNKYMYKQFLSCILIILVMLGTFFYLMSLITTNIVNNIGFKTLYGDQVDRIDLFFTHHFKGGFNFWILFLHLFVYFPTIYFKPSSSFQKASIRWAWPIQCNFLPTIRPSFFLSPD